MWKPLKKTLPYVPPLESQGNKPLQMNFEQQLKALVYFHLEEHESGRDLIQTLEEDNFARTAIAPPKGIKKSGFFEAINTRGLEQLTYVFERLHTQAYGTLPTKYSKLGELIAIDGSLIDAVLSMHWADYSKNSKKAKVHLGFNINRSIPSKIFLTNGKGAERPFVEKILSPGQTGITDRGYQHHGKFDLWHREGKYYVCRIKANTTKEVIRTNEINENPLIFYDAVVLLGTPNVNQTEEEVRLVAYRINGKEYWIATNRFDLTVEEIAMVYKLRWEIEKFFAWWKRHLKVYHLIARSEYGLMVQILAGLITYLLIAIYCYKNYNEKVSITRVRSLRIAIRNESRDFNFLYSRSLKSENSYDLYAKT